MYILFSCPCYKVNSMNYVTKYYVAKDNHKWKSQFVTLLIILSIVELVYYIYHF